MKHTSSTNQPFSGTLAPQEIEEKDDPLANDSQLAAIAAQLQETASYAINPEFKDELHKKLLRQFREYHTKENN